MGFKNLLKCILPPPVRTFYREINRVVDTVNAQGWKTRESLVQMKREYDEKLADIVRQNAELRIKLDAVKKQGEQTAKSIDAVKKQIPKITRSANEAVWANVFHDATVESTWLKNKSFFPGRWAVGYPVLYAMYRILNEVRPHNILELGLGQSTRMISQYVASFENVQHSVVEHDPEWISFFKNDFPLSERTKIVQLDREMVPFMDAEEVRVFSNFGDTFSGRKFDFILIDAPLGGDMKQYARIDVLGILPECLAESFVLMIDDYNRDGEKATVEQMKNKLQENNIEFASSVYAGAKDMFIMTSTDLKFLCSM